MSYVNTSVNAGEEVYDAATVADVNSRRNDTGKKEAYGHVRGSSTAQKVILNHSSMGEFHALCPSSFNLELSAEWMQRNGNSITDMVAKGASAATGRSGVGPVINKAAENSGISESRFKYLTCHFYEASAPIRASIPFEFIAESDAEREVLIPILSLYQMIAPYEAAGVLIPPGHL